VLLATVSQSSIEKYVGLAARLLNRFDVEEYLKKRFDVLMRELEELFGTKQSSLQADLLSYLSSE
jgi:DNA polymerase II large subunit